MTLPSIPPPVGSRMQLAAVLALGALGLMVWSLFDPSPIAVVVAMSVGQLLGTASLALFLLTAGKDLRRALRSEDEVDRTRRR